MTEPRRPRRVATRAINPSDVGALVRVLSALQVHLLSGDLPAPLTSSLTRHLAGAGLLDPSARPAELLIALDDLAARLRSGGTAAGASDETRHLVGFAEREQADAFAAGAARRAGDEVVGPEPAVPARWVDGVRWQVTVRVLEPPMTPAFDARIAWLHELADAHAGHLGGWEA
ncbi:Regulator of ribonuclease activity B [Klenkia marina]|uniref:Regulator of ribonuclease activity B n=1 Tax=Klenkia marina TaxID=1960309 RepID=A0A1G4YN29_9ACTN|nr:ribonuclease E inhibitor RraB [Klenkia marina]SCX54902.1 Regulator of ribonuclease activity B [Klenkia marina]